MTDLPPPDLLRPYVVKRFPMENQPLFWGRTEKTASCYEISCPCGETAFWVSHHSKRLEEPESPFFTTCSKCGRKALLFDSDIHGYNAQNHDAFTTRGQEEERIWSCPSCQAAGSVVLCVDYCIPSDDEIFTYENPEDWFDGIVLYHVCLTDHSVHFISGFECA